MGPLHYRGDTWEAGGGPRGTVGFIKKGQSSGLDSALNLLCDLKPVVGKGRKGKGRDWCQPRFSPRVLCFLFILFFWYWRGTQHVLGTQTPTEQHSSLTVFSAHGFLDASL